MGRVRSPRKAYFIVRRPIREIAEGNGMDLPESALAPAVVALLVDKITDGTVDHSMAVNEILPALAENPTLPLEDFLIQKKSDREEVEVLHREIRLLCDQYPDKVSLYRQGKKGIADMFVGMIMRAFAGHADPKTVHNLVVEVLEEKPAD